MCRVTQGGGDFIIIIHNFHIPHVLVELLRFQASGVAKLSVNCLATSIDLEVVVFHTNVIES